MNQKRTIRVVATVAAVAALIAVGVLVLAEPSGTTATPTSAATTTSFAAKVAKNLGIDEARLEAAIESAREQEIDEALAAGRITEEQASAMKERLAAQKAIDSLIADGVASGKITQEQADLLDGRGARGGMMGGPGAMGMGRGMGDAGRVEERCAGMGRGPGR